MSRRPLRIAEMDQDITHRPAAVRRGLGAAAQLAAGMLACRQGGALCLEALAGYLGLQV